MEKTSLHKRRVSLRVLVVALVLVAVCVAVVVSTSRAAVDEAAVAETIAGYETGIASLVAIPPDVLPTVEERLAALGDDKDRETIDDEGDTRVAILPEMFKAEIDAEYLKILKTYCSREMLTRHGATSGLAAALELGLYNDPEAPVVTEGLLEVLAVDVPSAEGDRCIAWALLWHGDVTTEGKGAEGWEVREYDLVAEDGTWLIDGVRSLGAVWGGNPDEWGPYTPHAPLKVREDGQPSSVYPDEAVLDAKLETLETQVDTE